MKIFYVYIFYREFDLVVAVRRQSVCSFLFVEKGQTSRFTNFFVYFEHHSVNVPHEGTTFI